MGRMFWWGVTEAVQQHEREANIIHIGNPGFGLGVCKLAFALNKGAL